MPPRTIAALLYPGCLALDLVGPTEAFSYAIMQLAARGEPPPYRLLWLGERRGPVATISGLELGVQCALEECPEPIDTLLVPGMRTGDTSYRASGLPQWIGARAPRIRRVASICSGALILGEAGLLDGKRVTTHWMDSTDLQNWYPSTRVVADCIFCRDGAIYSSGGVTAGIDLALALIEEDLGHAVALTIAKRLIVPLKRSGNQAQFSELLLAQGSAPRFAALIEWIEANLREPLDVEGLAERVAMSPRNFSRQFAAATGLTPMKFVHARRLERGRVLLEQTGRRIGAIAADCGFDSEAGFRRAFTAALSIGPAAYRERFGSAPPP